MDIPSFADILKQLKINFWLIGIPFNDSNIKSRYYLFLLILTIMIIAESSFLISKMNSENLLELTFITPCLCIGILSYLKITFITIKRHKIFKLVECLDYLYSDVLKNYKRIEIIRPEVVTLKNVTRYYFILNAVLINVYNWYICVVCFTTVDALYCILTSHVCHHFTIMCEEIKNLNVDENVVNINEIIQNHQYVLKLSDDLEDIFNLPNLFNVLLGSIEICALGFNLTMGGWTQTPGCILFLVSVLLQILMMSFFGENITRESSRVGEAAFLCKWYDMDKMRKKNILILMIRSHKHSRLTAYKFSTISYSSFTKIISTSWSYFTILKTVYKPEAV
ncbi:olfactory receptor 42 [Aphomia sociella]